MRTTTSTKPAPSTGGHVRRDAPRRRAHEDLSRDSAPARPARTRPGTALRPGRGPLLRELEHPSQAVAHITPNWFASVMGTGVVAVAAHSLPLKGPLVEGLALAAWLVAATLLLVLTAAFAAHWARHRPTALAYARHPVMGGFYGAPAMALLTTGAGAHLIGERLIGASAGLTVFVVLWVLGTALGVATAVWVPFRTATRAGDTAASGEQVGGPLPAWMMPVVPPMVSASTGALLVPEVPEGQGRLALLLGCAALFGLSLLVGLMTATLVHGRLLTGGPLPVQAAPTTWITLGVVGQSATAALLLGPATASVAGAGSDAARVVHVLGEVFAAGMVGFGGLLLALAAALTLHAARRGLRFSLTWWSFTFPVGTCVTGTSGLAAATGSTAVAALAVALFGLLLVAVVVVAARTSAGAASGRLLLAA
ncbi:hypothetical protein WDZ17_11655 [Pseudokineococcus basanitobsidens]|uniref:C4-dicarboxylate transporter/malic acid transport protein n=1 Tax=Pseudokineococcus basanitobsidens TaxID=1926649 RepID=A0ABU8RLL2_9ACTN